MKLEIVSHCWRYSRLLTYQLSSLFLPPPTVAVCMTVFLTNDDDPTGKRMQEFLQFLMPSHVQVRGWHDYMRTILINYFSVSERRWASKRPRP